MNLIIYIVENSLDDREFRNFSESYLEKLEEDQ